MSTHSGRKFVPKTLALLLVLMAGIALAPSHVDAQRASKKMTKQDVIDLLTGDVKSDKVAEAAQKAGIAFQVTASVERDIRAVGGDDELINVLKSLAPRAPAAPPSNPPIAPPASAPQLIIESSPGQSQVYVDDEPVGTTSQQGRLKLTRFSAGSHTVRISLNGYHDHEETVTLTAGNPTTVTAALQKTQVTEIASPPQPPQTEETPTANTGQPGYLGVLPMEQQPSGARGVVLSGAAPGGPGEQIGLKAYDTILAVNGQMVTTPQALRAALSSHQVGEVVKITWYNGSTTVTKQARLVPYPAAQPTQPSQATQPTQPSGPPTLTNMPHNGFQTFYVAHDHQQNGQNYCVGIMSVGNGMVIYKGIKGNGPVHNFEIPLNTVREAGRNKLYLLNLGAFHIKLNRGTNYNFVVLNQQGQFQPPDPLLNAIDTAMGR